MKNDDVIHKRCPICDSPKLKFDVPKVHCIYQVCNSCNCIIGYKRFDREDFELEAILYEVKRALSECIKLVDTILEKRARNV